MPQEQFRIGPYFLGKRANSPSWCACWFDPAARQTRRASLGTKDFQTAKLRLAEYVTKKETVREAKPEHVLFESILIRYWANHAQHLPSAEQAKYALAMWSDHFSEAAVSELTPQRQKSFVEALRAKGLRPSYISRVLSVGRAAIRFAWKQGELLTVPFIMDVQRDLEQEAERFPNLDMEQVAYLLRAAAGTDHLLTFCMLSLNTLARPDAVLQLGPDQVDLKRRLIALNPKGRRQTKKYRPVVPVSDTLLPWLRQCRGLSYVQYRDKPVAPVKKSFSRIAAVAGLRGVSPYCLRHTMATELRARNVPEWEVMGMLGHKSRQARTSERYAKYRPDYLGEAVRAIDGYFAELRREFSHLLPEVVFTPVRASSVLVPNLDNAKMAEKMVGATGIEPVTPAMSTQCSYR
jgi:integrase